MVKSIFVDENVSHKLSIKIFLYFLRCTLVTNPLFDSLLKILKIYDRFIKFIYKITCTSCE